MGEGFTSQLCMSNTGDATGYQPGYEVIIPDGVTLDSATYIGTDVRNEFIETCTFTLPGQTECNATNPYTDQNITLDENQSLYLLAYPLGSFPTDMPSQCIDLGLTLGSSPDVTVNVPLEIKSTALFYLGTDPLDNPQVDPPIYDTQKTQEVIPVIFRLFKNFNATEGETVSGENFPNTVTLSVDIANGETVENVTVSDDLPGELQYLSMVDNDGCTVLSEPSTTVPGGILSLDCSDITGATGLDKNIVFSFYVPERDDNNNPILDPLTGTHTPVLNITNGEYTYDSTISTADANDTLAVKPFSIQKEMQIFQDNGVPGLSPTDILEYTITINLSDYFDIENMVLEDIVNSTQSAVNLDTSTYTVTSSTVSVTGNFTQGSSVVTSLPFIGSQKIDFDLSLAMQENGHDSNLTGGDGTGLGTSVIIRFQTQVNRVRRDGPPGLEYVKAGDFVNNDVDMNASNVNGSFDLPSDDSSTSSQIAVGTGTKSVYAINGSTSIAAPYTIKAGDTLTYRVIIDFPIDSFQNGVLTDYLPLPIFLASEMTSGSMSQYDKSILAPDAGQWSTGPLHDINLTNIDTDFNVSTAQNTISWSTDPRLGDENTSRSGTVDLLFTLTATNTPMADELNLANLAILTYTNSPGDTLTASSVVNITTYQPVIKAENLKTIISSSNPNSALITPPADFDSAMDSVDANDTITFKIRLENTGHATAYDVDVSDRFSQGGIVGQGLNSCTITGTDTNSTGSTVSGDLFTNVYSISQIDAGAYFDIDYTCVVDQDANPGDDIDNTATLLSYASTPGGPNFVNQLEESKSKLQLTGKMQIAKTIASTSIPDTLGSSINQGEIVNFEINVTLGEGTYTNYALSDNTCTNLQLAGTSANVTASGLSGTVIVDGTGGSVDGSLLYTCETQAIVSGTNTATVTADLMGSETASTTWTVVDPNVITSKNMNPSQADAGDTVTVTMDWTNDSSNPAYQCTVTDPLDASVFDISSVTMTVIPSGYTCNVVGNDVECVYTGDLTLPCPDGPAEFTVNVRDDVNTSANLVNELSFTGVTLPSGHPNEGDPAINGSVESNATDTLELRSPAQPVKSFTATSENFTDPGDINLNATPDVALGEVIDVNITYGFYEGTTLNVDLDERFLDGGRLVYVPGTMTINRSDTNLIVEDGDINSDLGAVAAGVAVAVDDSKLTLSNTLIRLPLGDVSNLNSSSTSETASLTLQFRVKVQNESSVQSGVLIRDRGRVRFEDSISGATRTSQSTVRSARTSEPLPTITKDVNQTSVRAGTELTYTLRVCNDETNSGSSVTSGFDWIISDRIPDDILRSSAITVNLNGTGATVDTSASSGQDINATIDRLDQGECITITYEAIVQQSAQFGEILSNTANFSTTSLPGSYGSAGSLSELGTQEPGDLNGERTGIGGVNDLFGSDTQIVTMDRGFIEKRVVAHKQYYAIGEEVHYQIDVGTPAGSAHNVVINDILPVGLEFNASSVSYRIGSNLTVEFPSPTPVQNGQIVSFEFGDVNASALTGLIIDYNSTVSNMPSNQDGISLQNDANVTYTDPNNPSLQGVLTPFIPARQIVVGEPNLEIQKSITAGAVNAQAGDMVSWQVVISNDPANNAHTTAYAVDWEDVLPSHLADIQNAALSQTGADVNLTGQPIRLDSSHLIENNTTLSLPLFDLLVGSTVTITFDSIVQNDAVAGEVQTNTTNASYMSLPAADGSLLGGRNSDNCGDDDDDSALNNYCESATADLVIDAGIAVDKRLQGTQVNYTIGETLTYEMRISLIEGITQNVVLTDTLPAGLRYVSHAHQNGAPAMTYDFSSANLNSGTAQNVIIDFGDVNNSADGNTTNDYIDVELTVLIENVSGNQNGDTPSNGDIADGSSVTVVSDANTSEVTVPVPINIVEPDLNVTKSVTPDTQALGDIVTYTIRLAHSNISTSDAYDINFTDTLPAELTYIPGSITGVPAADFAQNGQVLTFGFAHLPLAATRDISYKARISDTASIAAPLVNALDTVYSGLPDANGSADGGRNGTDGVGGGLNDYALFTQASVQPNNDALTPVKDQAVKVDTNNDGLINAGDILEYNLSVTNALAYDVGDVNVTDVLDPNVTLLLDSIMINGTAYGDNSAADWSVNGFWYTYASSDVDISYNSDTNYFEIYWLNLVSAGDILGITYDVVINDGSVTTVSFADASTIDLAAGAAVEPGTVIDNIFTVDSNRTIPVDSNDVNITTDQRGIAGIPDKNITGSDQSFTTLTDVSVGEVIDVELTFAFSGGTTREVKLRDNYDPDQFAFVAGSAQLIRSSALIDVTDPLLAGTAVPDAKIIEDGNGFELDVGDVLNTNYQELNMTEILTLSFQLQVQNTTSVNRNDTLDDRADVTYLDYNRSGGQPDRNVTLQSDMVSVTVLEPLPTVSKVNSNAAAQPGDPVTYTVTFCNDEAGTAANVAPAFDWTATDILDVRLQPQGSPRTDTGTTGATIGATFSGQTLSVTIDQLDQGECVNVEYDILIDGTAAVDANISNTINMQTTTLPGVVTGERTGTGTPVENDLNAFATSDIIIGQPSILKDVTAQQTFYAIGESVDYNVTINLPESVRSLEINDTLPAGLTYNAGSVRLVVPAAVTVQNDPPSVSQNGGVVRFDLGDVNMTGKQTIYLAFNATVENIGTNQQTTTLTNQVNMAYIEPDNNVALILPNVNAPAITVGEPTIVMTNMVTAGLVDSQAGDTISYSITLENTGTTTAFATDWIDTLPEHLAEISNVSLLGTAYQSGTTTALVDADFILSTVNAIDDTVSLPLFDLPVGNTLTITFDSIVQLDAVANEILNNQTTSTWKSTLDSGARDGTDGIGGVLNDYAAEANASVEINATIAIQKSLLGDTSYAIGEELTYKLSVFFIRGITPDVNVTDVLPDGLSYVSHTTQSTDVAGLTYASDLKSGSGQTVVISLGDVNNSATNNDSIDIEMTVRVDNVAGNQDGDQPVNGGPSGTSVTASYTTPGVGTTEANVSNGVSFTITEPNVSAVKSVTPDTQALGDEVTYTIQVTNSGTSTAFDINLTDTLPIGLTYIDGSSSDAGVIHNGQVLTFGLAPLAVGASVDISYKATVDTSAAVNVDLVNMINGVYGSIVDANGSVDGGRNGMDGISGVNNYVFEANATLLPNDDALTPVKSLTWEQDSNNDTVISAGDLLRYDLSVTNNLAYDVSEVNVTDTLSPNVTLMLDSVRINGTAYGENSSSDWSVNGFWYTYASSDVDISYNSDTNYFEVYWQNVLTAGDTLDISFDTKINDGNITEVVFSDSSTVDLDAKTVVTAGTLIENTFTVDSNRTVPTDSNEVNLTTDQRGIAVAPVKRLTATDQGFTDPGDINLANTPPVAVGEIIDVELFFEFSGGTTRSVVLRDNFDLQHFVYVPNSTMLERSSDRIEVNETDLNSSFASADTIAVDDSKIVSDANGFSLDIGDVFNDNYNAMNVTESLLLTFKLRVDNNDTVQAGTILNDHGGVSFSEYDPVTDTSSISELNSTEVGVVVVEPDVEVTKTVNPSTAVAGDMLTYTINVCNDESNTTAYTTSAFDWSVTDILPDELDLVGDPQYNGLSMFSGSDMDVTIPVIVPGECVSLEYNVTVNGAAQFEQDIINTVRVESTSLPGAVSGERTGTGTPPNDLNSSSTATLKIEEPAVVKAIVAQKAYYPIGDIVEYNITLAFTGSARDLTIVDHFPDGLAYVPGSARLSLPTGSVVSYDPPLESNIGNEWTFTIGDLNITTAGDLYLELNATVEDILINTDGTQLLNTLDMSFTDPNTGAPVTIAADAPLITLGEPELHISKGITTDLSVPKSAGDIISYEIILTNSGTTTAYSVMWEDKVPEHTGEIHNPHLEVHAGTAYEANTTIPVTDANFTISTVDEPDDHIVLVPFDLSPGASLVITFDTIIQPNVIPAETLVNSTSASTQSIPAGGRNTFVEVGVDGLTTDKYSTDSDVSFTINQLPEAIDDCTPPLHVTHYGPNAGDLGSNDILGDGTKEEHTWRVITQPRYGTVEVNEDGTYIYTPYADHNDVQDSFTYEIEDSNGDTDQARVCIDVDCASSQTSDGGDALGTMSMLLMLFLTGMVGLYYVRREEEMLN